MAELIIDAGRCVGCGACAGACPFGALHMEGELPRVDCDKCTLCGACAGECPADAIRVEAARSAQADLGDYHGIWVYAEQWQGTIDGTAFELLTRARELAREMGEPLSAVAVGSGMRAAAQELIAYGADRVYLLDAPALAMPDEEIYARLLADEIFRRRPAVVLYGASTFGRSLAPRVAAKLHTGLTADCTKLEIDPETKLLRQTRPAFGGNVMATILCPNHRPQMATVRPKVFRKELPEAPHSGEIVEAPVDTSKYDFKSRIVKAFDFPKGKLRLEDAEIIVSGGAGFKSREEYALVEELAEALGGCAGASRCAVDAGYAPHAQQVGQTGKVVAPKLYIAAGISGAIQHMVGMENADLIVAINKDPDAAIFQIADIGIVGDVMEILPRLTKAVLRAKQREAV